MVKHLRSEVTAESAPRGTIRSRADVMLVAGHEFPGRERFGAIGKEGAVLNKGMMSERSIGDEYRGA